MLELNMIGGGVKGIPRAGLLAKIMTPDMVDTIGLSFAEFYAQLPVEHQILYSADGITPYDDSTILVNIAGYVGLNEGELIGTVAKGYAQYADGTSREILNKALRHFGLPPIIDTADYWQRVDGSNILRTDGSPIEVI